MFALFQSLQAPACRDNMIKVGGHGILGEFHSAQDNNFIQMKVNVHNIKLPDKDLMEHIL
jgi:hypothetical protein